MHKKNIGLTPEERELFRHNVKVNHVLLQDKQTTQKKKPQKQLIIESTQREKKFQGEAAALLEKLSPKDWLTAQDYIQFARIGIPSGLLNKLKCGHLSMEAHLDLHGLTGDEAIEKIDVFLEYCAEKRIRSVLIIHGKGGNAPAKPPTLKNVAHQWLRQHSRVLAFYSAKAKHGGNGALYLLLKLRNEYEK